MASELHKPPTALVAVAILGGILVVVLAAIALGQYAGFAMEDELDKKVRERPPLELMTLRQREAERLSRYQWVDPKAGVVRIPVERALELTLKEWPNR